MKDTVKDKNVDLVVDRDITNGIHQSQDYEICQCSYCRNYYATILNHMPTELQELLLRLGIEILKPSEAVEHGQTENGMSHYITDYHFVGKVVSQSYPNELDTSRFDYAYFPNDKTLAFRKFDDFDIVAVRVNIFLPWEINEPYE